MLPPGPSGQFVRQNASSAGEYLAFVPAPLPPAPALVLDAKWLEAESRAVLALGRLDGGMRYLVDPNLFLYMYVRNEAVLSSQIEGTQSTLSDLLLFEHDGVPSVPLADVKEVSAYVRALNHGVRRLADLPISTRLLAEVHRELLSGTRGNDKAPGEVRTTQNWIGGSMPGNAHFVPPPPHLVGELLSNLDKFVNDVPERTRPLLKAGIAHAQFETIHPFLDGNGRVGRLLITLILVAEKVLHAPLLYLSLHFKEHRTEYYERLQRVRTHGEWLPWLAFFFAGVERVAEQADATVRAVMDLFRRHHAAIMSLGGRGIATVMRVYEVAQREAVVAIPGLVKSTGLTHPTVSQAVKSLVDLGVLTEVTGKTRDRRFLYDSYVTLLSQGPR
jgi:Fic family protein